MAGSFSTALGSSTCSALVSDESGPAIRRHDLATGALEQTLSLPAVFSHHRSNLSLESLALTFAENVYAVEDGQGLFHWAAPWLRNKRYAKLDDIRKELGFEQGSLIAPVAFADPLRNDFRLPANAPESVRRAYPRGDVPGVRVGMAPAEAVRPGLK